MSYVVPVLSVKGICSLCPVIMDIFPPQFQVGQGIKFESQLLHCIFCMPSRVLSAYISAYLLIVARMCHSANWTLESTEQEG